MFGLLSDWLKDQVGEIILLAGLITALGVISHKGYRFFKTAIEVAEFVKHELNENSGQSLRDYTVRTDRRFEWLVDQMGLELPDELKSPVPKEGTPP